MARYAFTLSLPDAAGASRMAWHFAAAFRRKGHEVVLIHGPEPRENSSIVPEMHALGVRTICEPGLAVPASPWLSGRLARLMRQEQLAGVIGVQQRDRAIAVQAAAAAGIPGVIHLGNNHRFWGAWPVSQLKEFYYRRTLKRCVSMVVCTNATLKTEMMERFQLGADRLCVLPNGLDLAKYAPSGNVDREAVRAEFGVAPHEAMFVNVGRINYQKAQDLLLQAFARLNFAQTPAKLVLVGDVAKDAQFARMEKFRLDLHAFLRERGLSDRVIFAGWRDDIPQLLQAADAYVHSARWEGFGLASFEAMAAAKPTIWTDCWGRPAGFVDGEHGWLVPTSDVAALHAALHAFLTLNSQRRHDIGAAGRAFVEQNYDIKVIGDKFVDIIESVSVAA
jgi:glycosyltransferase involved in cell wall biosynthesis